MHGKLIYSSHKDQIQLIFACYLILLRQPELCFFCGFALIRRGNKQNAFIKEYRDNLLTG